MVFLPSDSIMEVSKFVKSIGSFSRLELHGIVRTTYILQVYQQVVVGRELCHVYWLWVPACFPPQPTEDSANNAIGPWEINQASHVSSHLSPGCSRRSCLDLLIDYSVQPKRMRGERSIKIATRTAGNLLLGLQHPSSISSHMVQYSWFLIDTLFAFSIYKDRLRRNDGQLPLHFHPVLCR